jgi:hypothetical protein
VAENEVACLRIAPRTDDDHPDSCRRVPQISEPAKTRFVVEVRYHDQRREVGFLDRLERASRGTLSRYVANARFPVPTW